MKQVFLLLLLVLYCDGVKIVKRFINEQNSTTDDSFQVNVSAGYGVHFDNTTTSSQSPVYVFQDRKSNETDQIQQASQQIKEIIPTPVYQVHEKTPEVQEKKFQVAKNHRYRTVEKRVRQRNEIRKPVNDLEYKEPARHQPGKVAASGTKIVEVLRVPAMYELHLQSDPQRLVTLNTMWLNKLNTLMHQNQYKRPTIQPAYNMAGVTRNLIPQASTQSLNYAQPFGINNPQRFPALKPKISNQKLISEASNQIRTSYGVGQLKPISQNFKNNHLIPQSYQNSYQHTSTESTKVNQEPPTQAPLNYRQLSNEIPADYYQKPQALHEVPAPVLNTQPHKQNLPKIKATSVPNLVYGKPIDTAYQTSTQPPVPAPGLWGQNNQNQNQIGSSNQYQGQSDQVRNYYQPQPQQQQQQQQQYSDSYSQESLAQYNQYHPKKSPFHDGHYRGYNNAQNYYNDAIGDYLDQSLVNVNGGLPTYLNNDGTMTVQNFHHNPKLYRPPPDYEIPVTEEPNMEDVGQDFNVGIMPYSQDNDFTNLNNQLYNTYNSDGLMNDNQIETVDNQRYGDQNTADLGRLLLATSRSSMEAQKNEPINSFGRTSFSKRVRQRPLSYNRRMEPMDYILYIKERRSD